MWSSSKFPPKMNIPRAEMRMVPEILGLLHIGGLNNFREVFGSNSAFFKDKPWYISSFNDGASGAQRFSAGGYNFLHITLEMQPADDVLT